MIPAGLINPAICGGNMLKQSSNFAHYSQILCSIVALISLGVAILTFTSDSANAILLGFLWLALSVVFWLSARFVSNNNAKNQPDTSSDSGA